GRGPTREAWWLWPTPGVGDAGVSCGVIGRSTTAGAAPSPAGGTRRARGPRGGIWQALLPGVSGRSRLCRSSYSECLVRHADGVGHERERQVLGGQGRKPAAVDHVEIFEKIARGQGGKRGAAAGGRHPHGA